mgnify:CR=1 FL=1
MAAQTPAMSNGSCPITTGAKWCSTTAAAVGLEYVQPSPVSPCADTWTTTAVVSAHSKVPSASGYAVGTR